MNPVMEEVLARQLRSLKRIYLVMCVLCAGVVVAALVLGGPAGRLAGQTTLWWAQAALGLLGAVLLAVVVPLSRRRLLDPGRVREAGPDLLRSWGLSEAIAPQIARQAVYLTRFTAGCVVSWGLAASVALYGLVASLLGAHPAVTGAFLAAAVFTLLLLPPGAGQVRRGMERM